MRILTTAHDWIEVEYTQKGFKHRCETSLNTDQHCDPNAHRRELERVRSMTPEQFRREYKRCR